MTYSENRPNDLEIEHRKEIFLNLYQETFPRVFNYILTRTGDVVVTQDLVSIAVLRAYKFFINNDVPPHEDKIKGHAPWFMQIAKNTLRNYKRDTYRQTRHQFSLEELSEEGESSVDEIFSIDNNFLSEEFFPPEDQTINRENMELLVKKINQLTIAQQDVVKLKLAGHTYPEIAEKLGKTKTAVRICYFKALESFRNRLSEKFSNK